MSKKGRYIEHPEYTEISGGLFFSEDLEIKEAVVEKLKEKYRGIAEALRQERLHFTVPRELETLNNASALFTTPIPTPTPPPPTPSFSSMSEREIIRYYDSISIEF